MRLDGNIRRSNASIACLRHTGRPKAGRSTLIHQPFKKGQTSQTPRGKSVTTLKKENVMEGVEERNASKRDCLILSNLWDGI